MKPGFQQDTVLVSTSDGRNDTFVTALTYLAQDGRLFRIPPGTTTDGFSVPRMFQNIIPATGGSWMAAVLHDSAYRQTLQVFSVTNQQFEFANLQQAESDALILEAMEVQGVGFVLRHTIYRALRMFGARAYRQGLEHMDNLRRLLGPAAVCLLLMLSTGCARWLVPTTEISGTVGGMPFRFSGPKDTSADSIRIEVATNGTAMIQLTNFKTKNSPEVITASGDTFNQSLETAFNGGYKLGAQLAAPH